MRNKIRRLLSFKAVYAYFILFLIGINQAVSSLSNIDFVLSAPNNPKLVAVWDFFVSPKGNFIAILLVGIYLTVLVLIPERNQQTTTDKESEMPKAGTDLSESASTQLASVPKGFELYKLEPNLVCSGGSRVLAYEAKNGVIVEGEKPGSKEILAVVLPFHNDPNVRINNQDKKIGVIKKSQGLKIGAINNVSAQISYKFFNGQSTFVLNRGAWLSENVSRVDFEINDKRKLIIAVIGIKEAEKLYTVERDFNSVHPEGVSKYTELGSDIIQVLIRLIDESDGTKINELEYIIDVIREPVFTVEIIRFKTWRWMKLTQLQIDGLNLTNKIYSADRQEEVLDEVKDWEEKCGDFIGKFLTEGQKTRFLNAYPTKEAGLKGELNMTIYLPGMKPQATPPRNWTLADSVKARTKILEEYKGAPI